MQKVPDDSGFHQKKGFPSLVVADLTGAYPTHELTPDTRGGEPQARAHRARAQALQRDTCTSHTEQVG